MFRIAFVIAVIATMFIAGTASAAQSQSRNARPAAQGTRNGPVAKLIELERRKNEWLRETFMKR